MLIDNSGCYERATMPKYKIGKYTQAQLNNKRKYIRKRKYNSKYRGTLTIRKQKEQRRLVLMLMTGFILIGIVQYVTLTTNTIHIKGGEVVSKVQAGEQAPTQSIGGVQSLVATPPSDEVREITAYNAGDPYQCDDTPCISASNDNICEMLAQGINVCATNKESFGTILEIEGLGECIVLDRMNSRFTDRIDWAMQAHEKPQAIAFGLKNLKVKIKL